MEIIPITPQPQQQSAAPETTSPGKDDTGFNQIFTEKVSENQEQQAPDQERTAGRETAPDNAEQQATRGAEPPAQTTAANQPPSPADPASETSVPAEPADNSRRSASWYNQSVRFQAISLSTTVKAEFSGQSAPLQTQQFQFNSLEELAGITNRLFSFPSSAEHSTSSPVTIRLIVEQGGTVQQAAPMTNRNSLLLEEIQKLIHQHHDSVSMRARFAPTDGSRGYPGFLNGPLNGTVTTSTEGGNATLTVALQEGPIPALEIPLTLQQDGSNGQRQPTLRQEAAEQLLNARITGNPEKGEEKSGTSADNSKQNNGSGQQQATASQSGLPQSAPGTLEPNSGTQTFVSHFNTATTTPGVDSASPQPLHTSMQQQYIQENQVISQIVNRFQLHAKLQSGRMTLQLHPAELGKLKVDVEMKGDSLKANIVAQTQQAQEIIERNLPRLRAMLQQQGLKVEDLLVTFESDIIDDFSGRQHNLFKEQTAGFDSTSGKDLNRTAFARVIDESLDEEIPSYQGVNLTA